MHIARGSVSSFSFSFPIKPRTRLLHSCERVPFSLCRLQYASCAACCAGVGCAPIVRLPIVDTHRQLRNVCSVLRSCNKNRASHQAHHSTIVFSEFCLVLGHLPRIPFDTYRTGGIRSCIKTALLLHGPCIRVSKLCASFRCSSNGRNLFPVLDLRSTVCILLC